MTYNGFVLIIFALFAVLTYLLSIFIGKEEDSIPNTLFSSGITLIMSCIPETSDTIMEIIAKLMNISLGEDEGEYWFKAVIGLILIILGIVLNLALKQRVYVLNMYGIATQKDIDESKALKELKLVEYKVKEQVIDFVQFFNNGTTMEPKINQMICKHIENATSKFSAKVAEQKETCFTGMAPIPYTVYAGTFLESAKINRYFEYNNRNGGCYYELKKKIKKKEQNSLQSLNLSFPQTLNHGVSEVVLAISISHEVKESDLAQFSTDVVHISLSNPQDNIIKYSQQLNNYIDEIYEAIETKLKSNYPNLQMIHIVASVPSCVSLEIGKRIGLRTNRVCDIVVHHYVSSSNPPYVFGLYVNGSKKGQLYHN